MEPASESAADLRAGPRGPRSSAVWLIAALASLVLAPPAAQAADDVEVIQHSGDSESDSEGEESSSDASDETSDSGREGGDEVIEHAEESDGESEAIEHDEEPEGEREESGEDEGAGSDAAAARSDAGFSARYATGVWVDTGWEGGGEDIVEWRGEAGLDLEQTLSTHWNAVAGGEFRYWMGGRRNDDGPNLLVNASAPRAAAEVRLEETYVLFRSNRWAFRGGHLRTPWGSTSLVRPGDVVNPVDASAFEDPSDAGGRLLPQPSAELSYVRPNWDLTAVFVPFFVPNRVTLFGRDSAVAAGPNRAIGRGLPVADLFQQFLDRSVYEEAQPLLASPSRPDERPENASLGFRWTGTRWNTDFGLGYFFGWDRTPSIEVDEDLRALAELAVEDGQVLRDFDIQGFIGREPEALDRFDSLFDSRRVGESLIDIEHERLHSIVADVSRYVGPVGLRADVAFHPERTWVTRGLRTIRRPTLFAAAGASYERFVSDRPLVATLEGFWLEPFASDAAPTQWFVGEEERGSEDSEILLVGDRYRGAAAAVDWSLPVAELELRLGSIVELDSGGVIFNGRVSRRWASWFRTSIGATVYEGVAGSDDLSVGGLYDRNDRIGFRATGDF